MSLSYELAKQLKDAGFPQWDNVYSHYGWTKNEGWHITAHSTEYKGFVAAPNLLELIQHCGDRFKQLVNLFPVDLWSAESYTGIEATADTGEEAVARLWLALNAVSDDQREESSALNSQSVK